jgi:hypothetical protein
VLSNFRDQKKSSYCPAFFYPDIFLPFGPLSLFTIRKSLLPSSLHFTIRNSKFTIFSSPQPLAVHDVTFTHQAVLKNCTQLTIRPFFGNKNRPSSVLYLGEKHFDKKLETMTTKSKPPTSSRARPAFVSFAGPVSFTVHHSKFTLYHLPTTCGDIQQKKCALDFGPSGNSMENAPPLSSRVHPFILEFYAASSIQSPPMTFHSENVFRSPFLVNNDFHQSHLTPMITLQINPENQISRGGSMLRHAAVGEGLHPDVLTTKRPTRETCRPSPGNPLLRDERVRLESLTYT